MGQSMKTTKAEFERFKKSFLWWAEKLHCDYRCYFLHEPVKGGFAEVFMSESGKVATVRFGSFLNKTDYKVKPSPEQVGKHEALHLLLHRLSWLGEQRWTGSEEISHEEHRIIRVLEKVL